MLKKEFLEKYKKMKVIEWTNVALIFKCDCGFNAPMSWGVVKLEVSNNTKLGRKILRQLKY